ncbi:MAG: VWA domain-containing protein [Ketobacter sp.]|nr:MAG: VWA domain-containing protein [Ketobacter sp.]
MSEFLQQIEQFHFLRPLWLLAILPAIVLTVFLWRRKAAYGAWQKIISPNLLPHLLAGNVARQSKIPLLMLAVCWVLAIVALAGPTWKQLPQAVQKKVQAQVIVMDLSLSMYAKDLSPSRLVRARMKLNDILHNKTEGLTALIVFAGTPHVVTPLTDDNNTILSMVNSLNPDIMPIKGSDPVAAVNKAVNVLKQAGFDSGRILLMTDELPANFAAKLSDVIGFRTPLSVMGIGTPQGAPIALPDGTFIKSSNGNVVVPKLDVSAMKKAASTLSARFSTISTNNDDLDYLLAEGVLPSEQEMKDTGREFDVWDEAGHWLVLFILPLAAAGFRRGWLSCLVAPTFASLVLLGHSNESQAMGWDDLWQTPDQQAQQTLQQGDPKTAAEHFENPQWKASSFYKAQDYEAAESYFSKGQDADSLYNLGNAQARLQKLDEAIASYEKALELNPDMSDAKANLDLVKNLKQQQKQQEQQGDGEDKKQDQKDQQEQQDQKDQKDQKNDSEQNQSGKQDEDQESQQDQNQQQQDKEQKQEEQQQEQEEQQAQQEQPEQEADSEQADPMPAMPERTEDQQALEQWLRRIPDDPGGLLQRKFQHESQLRQNSSNGDPTW